MRACLAMPARVGRIPPSPYAAVGRTQIGRVIPNALRKCEFTKSVAPTRKLEDTIKIRYMAHSFIQ